MAGLRVVVDFLTSSEIASAEIKRRVPMTTLGSSPLRSRS
jgi:hypothetical protein